MPSVTVHVRVTRVDVTVRGNGQAGVSALAEDTIPSSGLLHVFRARRLCTSGAELRCRERGGVGRLHESGCVAARESAEIMEGHRWRHRLSSDRPHVRGRCVAHRNASVDM